MLEFVDQSREHRITALKETHQQYFTGIPGYATMEEPDKLHYEDLYLLACCPELLKTNAADEGIDSNLLPLSLTDLHALIYFIFQYNLDNEYIDGIHITPFIPITWTQENGLIMNMQGGIFASLLEKIADLNSTISLYFSVLMLSLLIIMNPCQEAPNYRLLILLLATMLDGHYDQTQLNSVKINQNNLSESWLLNYLPTPNTMVMNTEPSIRQTIKETLLGTGQRRGMFLPPALTIAQPLLDQIPVRRHSCLIL